MATKSRSKRIDGFYKARNSKRENWESAEWFFILKVDGQRKPFKGYTDLELSRKLRRDLITQIERHRERLPVQIAGCSPLLLKHLERLDITDAAKKRSLSENVQEYCQHLESKDDGEEHVQRTLSRIEKIIQGCRFKRTSDIKATPIRLFLHELRATDEIGKTTFNHYIRTMKGFINYLVEEERIENNPLAKLKLLYRPRGETAVFRVGRRW